MNRNRPAHVYMKNSPESVNHGMKYSILRDGSNFGGSISREGILIVLLSLIRNYTGRFKVVEEDTGDVILEYVVDQPCWTVDEIPLKPWEHRHEWRNNRFYAGDEADEEYMFSGWYRGGKWNGWEDPWFRRSEVAKIIDMISTTPYNLDKHEGYKFVWIDDVLIVQDANLGSTTVYEPEVITIGDERITIWNLFGGGYFTWEANDA